MSIHSIFTFKPVLYEICKNLNNKERSIFFRSCKGLNRWRDEPTYQKLFCITLGMTIPIRGTEWPETYSKIKELFSAKKISVKLIKEGENAELSQLVTIKTVHDIIQRRRKIEDKLYFRIHEESEGAYYSSEGNLMHVSEEDKKLKDVLRTLTGISGTCRGMVTLGNSDVGIVLVTKGQDDRTLSIIDMHQFKCVNSITLELPARGICSKGAHVFVLADNKYYEIEFKK